MNVCKKCGAEIIWIKTPKGSAMPCNAKPVFYADSKEDPQLKKMTRLSAMTALFTEV